MLAAGTIAAAPPVPRLVVLDIELTGDPGGPELRAEHAARLQMAGARLRQELAAGGLYRVVDNAPAQALIDKLKSQQLYLHDCNGCDLDIGRQLGADKVLVAWVNRVSGLILTLTYEIHDVATGQIADRKSYDFRGDNDAAWTHAIDYMVQDLKERGRGQPSEAQTCHAGRPEAEPSKLRRRSTLATFALKKEDFDTAQSANHRRARRLPRLRPHAGSAGPESAAGGCVQALRWDACRTRDRSCGSTAGTDVRGAPSVAAGPHLAAGDSLVLGAERQSWLQTGVTALWSGVSRRSPPSSAYSVWLCVRLPRPAHVGSGFAALWSRWSARHAIPLGKASAPLDDDRGLPGRLLRRV